MPRPGWKHFTIKEEELQKLQELTGTTGIDALRTVMRGYRKAKKEAERLNDAGIDPVGADKSLQTTPSGFPPQAMKDEASRNNEPAPEPPQVLKRVEAERQIYEMKMNLEKEKQRTKLTQPPRSANQSTGGSAYVNNWDSAPRSFGSPLRETWHYHCLIGGGCGGFHEPDKPCTGPAWPKPEWEPDPWPTYAPVTNFSFVFPDLGKK